VGALPKGGAFLEYLMEHVLHNKHKTERLFMGSQNTQIMTQEYFDFIISRGVNDFTGLNLNDLKAMGCDFSGATFNKTNLNDVDFRQSKFINPTIFQDCRMHDVIFRRCDLSYSRFSGSSILRGEYHNALMITTQFKECDLSGSVFDGANIHGVVFRDCRLEGADFDKAFRVQDVSFINCDLTGTKIGRQEGNNITILNDS
jgi:uncharacterized protein YjbI with pentapeptide repeats